MRALIGIDIGTSGIKALACDTRGRVVRSVTVPHTPDTPRPGWSEQEPEVWWQGTRAAIGKLFAGGGRGRLRPEDVIALGLSGQMHGSVFLGREALGGHPEARALRPALMWNDQRTAAQCAEIERAMGGRARLVELVGNAALTGFTLPKMLWVREREPRTWAKVRQVVLPKDFINFRLTGRLTTDVGDASGTLLLDVDRRAWSTPMLRGLGIDPALLPPVLESAQLAGRVCAWAARATGLREGTPVAAGSGDNMCGAIGAGVVVPGIAMAMLGTSGVILAHADRPRKDLPKSRGKAAAAPSGRLHSMCAATGSDGSPTPPGWCNTGVMLSAAGSLAWCRDTIAPGTSFDVLLKEASLAPPGSGGLVFLPYLTGERCPHPDPRARGGWIGLTSRHTRAHLVRSVIEGVTFGMAGILDLVRDLGVRVNQVRLSGGGNRSALWRQMQADIYDCPVSTTNTEEGGSALGGAILAGIAASVWPSVAEACRDVVKTTGTLRPRPSTQALYHEPREVYNSLYDRLRDQLHTLSAVDEASAPRPLPRKR